MGWLGAGIAHVVEATRRHKHPPIIAVLSGPTAADIPPRIDIRPVSADPPSHRAVTRAGPRMNRRRFIDRLRRLALNRCIHPGCTDDGAMAHPDGGPGALCGRHWITTRHKDTPR